MRHNSSLGLNMAFILSPTRQFRLRLFALCLVFGCWPVPALASTTEARSAYDHGDYRAAFAEFRKLADKGDIEAQAMVGWMLSQGLGVRKDIQAGRVWLERAASVDGNLASAKAQHNLGVMYEKIGRAHV